MQKPLPHHIELSYLETFSVSLALSHKTINFISEKAAHNSI